MKIVFFGTPAFVIPLLQKIHNTYKDVRGGSPIVAVVTQKPKEVGRKKILTYSEVDKWAHKRKIQVFYSCLEFVNSRTSADIGILASYGEIVPNSLLNYFPHGILNVHPSLLPELRGASPIQSAIVLGMKETGVSIIKLDSKLDHGKIVGQFKQEISDDDTVESLRRKLLEKSEDFLINLMKPYMTHKINLKEQEDSKATFCKQLNKDDGFITEKILISVMNKDVKPTKKEIELGFLGNYKLEVTPQNIFNFIRAMDLWPGVWTIININDKEQRLKIIKAHLENGTIAIDEVQLEGKTKVTWKQFKEAYPTVFMQVKYSCNR